MIKDLMKRDKVLKEVEVVVETVADEEEAVKHNREAVTTIRKARVLKKPAVINNIE